MKNQIKNHMENQMKNHKIKQTKNVLWPSLDCQKNRQALLPACFFELEKMPFSKTRDKNLQNSIEQYLYDSQLSYNDNCVNVFNLNFSSDTCKCIRSKKEIIAEC